jgi:uncharacterized protein (DUF1501 family)
MSERPRAGYPGEQRAIHDAGITRRRFVTGLGVAAGAAAVAGYALSVWADGESGSTPRVHRPAPPQLRGRDDQTLVVVELGGGNDGLSTVVPLADPAYPRLRPTLAVSAPLALDASAGFHPNLAKLAARYRAGQVAIVEGVGYPEPNLSHFASLAYWWSGTPGEGGGPGWLGRYLDATVGYDDPLAGVAIGPVPSPALLGLQSFATSITDSTGLQPAVPAWADSADDLVRAWARFAPASPDPATVLGQVQQAIRSTVEARDDLRDDLVGAEDAATAPADDLTAGRAQGNYRRSASVADSMRLAAQLVAAEHAPRVLYVSGLGDYDTHQGQAQRHPALMTDLDDGIDAFFGTLEAAGRADRALVLTVSEFGRRGPENGSGTDHGAAAPHFVVGPKVKGGRYGTPPSLTSLDDHGNLVHTVDFRSLYATALEGWLGVDAEAILGTAFDPLPLL